MIWLNCDSISFKQPLDQCNCLFERETEAGLLCSKVLHFGELLWDSTVVKPYVCCIVVGSISKYRPTGSVKFNCLRCDDTVVNGTSDVLVGDASGDVAVCWFSSH